MEQRKKMRKMKHLNMKMRKERIKDQEVQHWAIENETSNKHEKDSREYESDENWNAGWCEQQSEKDQIRNKE